MGYKKQYPKTYGIWCAMKTRCNNPNAINYENYGGRGISVCDSWKSFENFFQDMGEAPDGMSIERNDTNGNYEPNNCRWATRKEQNNNKRNHNMIEYCGFNMNVMQWSKHTGIGESTIRRRIKLGWTPEKILTTRPVIGRNQLWSKAV